jgi:hypothetical protein
MKPEHPSLSEALKDLKKQSLDELMCFMKPPTLVKVVGDGMVIAF